MTSGLDGTTGFRAMELTPDCHGVVPSSDLRITSTANREGPAMFVHEDSYYLWCSGTMGWSPTRMYVYAATSPLGDFHVSAQDDHQYHGYTKGVTGNATIWDGTWNVTNSFLLTGPTYGANRGVQTITFGAAKALCAAADACGGFYFVNFDASPAETWNGTFTFRKTNFGLYEEKEVGMQPPPIPFPGQSGNNASEGAPGAWAYDSQSTYILANPKYSKGSKLAPFIYCGDRWWVRV